ncbi:hypothetical protein ACJMK2_018125 [Sinanodonta woodiana]|uniref:Neurotransmitter-gated ion-channel ligand-binding domain-containing protein n=1 Tax=Sinanodonta woodiana TaxID=1069815 RepID=A0ABD3UGE2_SINWO
MKILISLTTVMFVASVQSSSIHLSPKGQDGQSVSDNRSPGTRARERLMNTLLANYVKSVNPGPYDGSPLQINMSLSLINLDSVDTKERIIETHSLLWMTWTDERLSWNPSDYHEVNKLHMPTDSIWIPDIDLLNNDGDANKPVSDMIADVTSDGSVIYAPELHLKSLCETGQEAPEAARIARILGSSELVCKLLFGSWTYDTTEIKLVTPSSQMDMSTLIRLSADNFHVKSTSVEVDHKTFNCCPNDENKKKLPIQFATFTIVISNNPIYRRGYNTR